MSKIALQVIAFNVDTWLDKMLKNAAPFVDKIFIAYPPRPWAYSDYARKHLVNPTQIQNYKLETLPCETEIVQGDWRYEEETRNNLLNLAREEGFDWMVIQDADEFYTKESWERLIDVMNQNSEADLIITPWLNFWKSPEYVIESAEGNIKMLNEGYAIRCAASSAEFTHCRSSNAQNPIVVDEPCYHYGYVMPDEQMYMKIKTWAHAKDIFLPRLWYKLKWMCWTESSRNLHPSFPAVWPKAVRFPFEQPVFYANFMPTHLEKVPSRAVNIVFADFLWDMRALLQLRYRRCKSSIRNSLFKILQ